MALRDFHCAKRWADMSSEMDENSQGPDEKLRDLLGDSSEQHLKVSAPHPDFEASNLGVNGMFKKIMGVATPGKIKSTNTKTDAPKDFAFLLEEDGKDTAMTGAVERGAGKGKNSLASLCTGMPSTVAGRSTFMPSAGPDAGAAFGLCAPAGSIAPDVHTAENEEEMCGGDGGAGVGGGVVSMDTDSKAFKRSMAGQQAPSMSVDAAAAAGFAVCFEKGEGEGGAPSGFPSESELMDLEEKEKENQKFGRGTVATKKAKVEDAEGKVRPVPSAVAATHLIEEQHPNPLPNVQYTNVCLGTNPNPSLPLPGLGADMPTQAQMRPATGAEYRAVTANMAKQFEMHQNAVLREHRSSGRTSRGRGSGTRGSRGKQPGGMAGGAKAPATNGPQQQVSAQSQAQGQAQGQLQTEEEKHREKKRMEEIIKFKSTDTYKTFDRAFPNRQKANEGGHKKGKKQVASILPALPQTPDVRMKASSRVFQSLLTDWKREIHGKVETLPPPESKWC